MIFCKLNEIFSLNFVSVQCTELKVHFVIVHCILLLKSNKKIFDKSITKNCITIILENLDGMFVNFFFQAFMPVRNSMNEPITGL